MRNDWAFHYLDNVYRAALATARPNGTVLLSQSRGLSRYLVVDDLIQDGMVAVAGGREELQRATMRAIQLAQALGVIVDGLLVGLLKNIELRQARRVVRLEAALDRGLREAVARRLVPPDGAAGS